ncbi:thrombospondin type-1 domain-containing protein 4 isoform X2 [Cephus cinctus]|uniref:Thrombospondin type-1 domain-containing protein 4 isoform X2 n=1 Tax=Cephus cinctus TaxID=211228 RepID=A0AAJ7FD20_CEPCN|nr:thrombospondin type-1 domain-containing protein 4 isoform X2 [Cephus cinctus]
MQRLFLPLLLLCLLNLMTIGTGRLIDGIFTEPRLEPGYNLVATIPRGASALNVTELRHTQNYLAIRLRDGSFLINGNYNINWSGEYEAAGTTFVYLRQSSQHLESFAAAGPLTEPIDVMVLYQEPNPGIVYRYVMPHGPNPLQPNSRATYGAALGKTSDFTPPGPHQRKAEPGSPMVHDEPPAPPRRFRKRKFVWKASGLTECSKSCGGGVQSIKYICVRELTQVQVLEKRCHALEKPTSSGVKCNIKPCPAKWRSGPWSECSVSCGSGIRKRELECVQEVNSVLTIRVADGACLDPKTLPTSESCTMPECDERGKIAQSNLPSPYWSVGGWSSCSTTCGLGTRNRVITCITSGRPCSMDDKPDAQESCDPGPCLTKSTASNVISSGFHGPQWLFTEWSRKCSAECGTGIQTRRVFCGTSSRNESCDESNRPDTTRTCSSDRACSGQWFAGPWTQCSSTCDLGEQTREVACVTMLRGSLRVVLDMNCPASKPELKKPCRGPPCAPSWFTSDWTQCSRSCGKGMQKREVKCLSVNGQTFEQDHASCTENERPAARRACNEYPCKSNQDTYGVENSHRVMQVQNDPEISNGLDENPLCKDNFPNCNLVMQARLCAYPFYQKSCCLSCSSAKQENE